MTDYLDELGRIYGGFIERADNRTIPGTVDVEGVRVVYLRDDKTAPTADQFRKVSRKVDPSLLTHGGASEYGCLITTPDGKTFFCWGYHGDLEGWEKQITQGAQALGVTLATIEGDVFKRNDGVEVPLAECRVEFV
ncbi:hypothetical protein NFI95_12265 [Acetobacteraceae bacterium KSS8]|uniref:Uncharacterized protein n=1 Tax=Endosaccharibacter trunci TaxID=2812733 RepID=A0ABT1W8K8_9PROT|nr:hypothetical protein [Acetobacteraceae bacterium KSS8]